MNTPAQRAEIRRLYYGEHWKLGTIAAQLGLHRETVRAAVEHESGSVRGGVCRPTTLDPYLPFIRDPWSSTPGCAPHASTRWSVSAATQASVIQVRRLVRRLRHESTRTVYRRVVTLVGEQGQVDWGLLRQSPHRTRHTRRLRLRHGPRLLARHRRPLHPRPDPRELPPRTRRGFRGPGRRGPHTRLRQPAQRRARPPWHRRPVSPPPARARRPLPLRPRPCTPGRGK